MTAKPQEAILALGTDGYFNKMTEPMCKAAPPGAGDSEILGRMAKIGIEPCKTFDSSKLDPQVQKALKEIPHLALDKITGARGELGRQVNGWSVTTGLGQYGTNYLKRAVVAAFGWPANREKDAVYPYTFVDASGEQLNGAHKYTLTFPKDATPPVKGFWSITMYLIDKGWWFVPNELNRFTVSLRDKPKFNPDGSLTLYFQNQSPGKALESNWLPAPKGDFLLMLRMYWPSEDTPSILNGSWVPPVVHKTTPAAKQPLVGSETLLEEIGGRWEKRRACAGEADKKGLGILERISFMNECLNR
jgi:hypothetical protein